MSLESVIIMLFIAFEPGRWSAVLEISRILKLQARAQRRPIVRAGRRVRHRLHQPRLRHGAQTSDPDDLSG